MKHMEFILKELEEMFPDAHCELHHDTPFQLVCAVALSAQTTDAAVNKVTPALFEAFPTPKEMSQASLKEIEYYIKRIGLYRNKASNLKTMSQQLLDHFDGVVPNSMRDLTSLAGVGRKTANVVRSVAFDIPSVPVDTHVERISKRLGIAKPYDSVEVVEEKIKRKIPSALWNKVHHQFIFFGRYFCTARNPKCYHCPFQEFCKKDRLEKYQESKRKTA